MVKKKVLLVSNPKSGTGRRLLSSEKANELFGSWADVRLLDWPSPDANITDMVRDSIQKNRPDLVVANGGDGTINRTATALLHEKIPMGIIPSGSGNGLARHLKIPLNSRQAIEIIRLENIIEADSCNLNQTPFFCTAGTGFDAHVGNLFATAGTRGFKTYSRIVVREFKQYRSGQYRITIDGKTIEREAFLVTAANADQYGNNAYIAPRASIFDGLMKVVILKPFRAIDVPALAGRLFLKSIDHSKYTESYDAREVVIERESEGPIHYDGEPGTMGNTLNIKSVPSSIQFIVSPAFMKNKT